MFTQGSVNSHSIAEKKESANALLSPIFRTSDMVITFAMLPYMDTKALATFSQTSQHAYALTKLELNKKVMEILPDGNTRLASAIIGGKYEIAYALLKAKVDVNQCNTNKGMPLLYVAIKSRKLFKLLLDFKADPHAADGLPLYLAAQYEKYDMMHNLIAAGFNEFNNTYPARATDAITQPYALQVIPVDPTKIHEALDIVTVLLNKKAPFYGESNMIKFLLLVDQRKALKAFSELCGRTEECNIEEKRVYDLVTSTIINFSISAYTKKLKHVLTYAANPPDRIMKERDNCASLTRSMVEKLDRQIHRKNSHFSWFKSIMPSSVFNTDCELLERKNG